MPRKKRLRDQLAQRRRARLDSHSHNKSAAALFQRWLAEQHERFAAVEAKERETASLAEAGRKLDSANAHAHKDRGEPEVAGDAASFREGLDSVSILSKLFSNDPPWSAKTAEGATLSAAARRSAALQNQATFASPEKNEIARLQARAKAEMQRADFVTTLLEEVLGASAATIIKHQARLETLQAQINALQGR